MKPKKRFKVVKTELRVQQSYLYASSKEVAQELLDSYVPIGWQYIPEQSSVTLEIEEVEEDADQ